MVAVIAEKQISLAEFLSQPETKPAQEYIDGEITEKPMPQGKHSRIQAKLTNIINDIAEPKKIALAFPELRCTFDNKSIVPDIVVLKYGNIPQDQNGDIANIITTPPDWMIEIISPDQNHSKLLKKILRCLDCGCQLAWLIDPEEKTIFVYYPHHKTLYFDQESDPLPPPDFLTELNLTLGDIFAWLKL
jgi:Uma2 family endonuclease